MTDKDKQGTVKITETGNSKPAGATPEGATIKTGGKTYDIKVEDVHGR